MLKGCSLRKAENRWSLGSKGTPAWTHSLWTVSEELGTGSWGTLAGSHCCHWDTFSQPLILCPCGFGETRLIPLCSSLLFPGPLMMLSGDEGSCAGPQPTTKLRLCLLRTHTLVLVVRDLRHIVTDASGFIQTLQLARRRYGKVSGTLCRKTEHSQALWMEKAFRKMCVTMCLKCDRDNSYTLSSVT